MAEPWEKELARHEGNEFTNFDRCVIGYAKMNAYDKKIWNAAIKAAVDKAEEWGDSRVSIQELKELMK